MKSVKVGIFFAIHTFGRNLKYNVHIHLSMTTGGITTGQSQWKKRYFHQTTLMRRWRYDIIACIILVSYRIIVNGDLLKFCVRLIILNSTFVTEYEDLTLF
ncbi:MAG: hypothetical protein GY821_16465 [Gammaproteobacteria bacterium]|nr:hypothetical protein [Gammaproteobacteria bacterium]